MSLAATIWGWKQKGLSSTQKLVLLRLCDRANSNNECYPRQSSIAEDCELTERAVHSALKKLEAGGFISRKKRFKNGGRRTSDLITLSMKNDPSNASASAAFIPIQSERPSGEHQNDVRFDTGTTFGETCNIKPTRPNQERRSIRSEVFPIELADFYHNDAAQFVTSLPVVAIDSIDWDAPGINDGHLLKQWLEKLDLKDVRSRLLAAIERWQLGKSREKIRSWSYFADEMTDAKDVK
ncbi:hypothetical protein V1282_005779 [Nitrobacteraceae bacterium AZCC 2146]